MKRALRDSLLDAEISKVPKSWTNRACQPPSRAPLLKDTLATENNIDRKLRLHLGARAIRPRRSRFPLTSGFVTAKPQDFDGIRTVLGAR